MFHNKTANEAMEVVEKLYDIFDTITSDEGEQLTHEETVMLLAGVQLMLALVAEQLESATYCSICHAKLHHACPNCDTWDFDRER